jgi:chromosome segregation ATPase
MNTDLNRNDQNNGNSKSYTAPIAILSGALVIALAATGFLWVRSNHLSDDISQMRDGTNVQIAKLDAANEADRQEAQKRYEALQSSVSNANTAATTASKRAHAEVQQTAAQWKKQLDDHAEEFNGQITSLKDSDAQTADKITEVATNVTGVKTEVDEVKTDVGGVKDEVKTAQSSLEQHAAELRRMTGDMGVMSDRIATNGKDLDTLRALGERNYYEFKLAKVDKTKKVGDVILSFKKADPKRNRYSVDVTADDKRVEKKDKTVNEPLQIFIAGNRQPSEVVVNQVNKDEIVGYVSVPKVMVSRR